MKMKMKIFNYFYFITLGEFDEFKSIIHNEQSVSFEN